MTAFYKQVLFCAVAACVVLPCTATAQSNDNQRDDRPPQARQQQQQKNRLAMLAQRLNLTKEQKQQWQQINRETNDKVWAARKDDSLNEQQMQAQLREIHKQHDQQILAMLSPDQQDALKEFWQEQKQKQQDKSSDNNSGANSSAQNSDNGKGKDDDLFAGMVSDDPAPSQPPQPKKAAHK